MPFKKGESGNPKGKPKGAIGKKTAIWNEIGEWFANDGIQAYQENLIDLMTHEDTDVRLKAMDKFNALIEFFKPKLARTELVGDEKKPLSIVTEFKIPNNDRE